MPPRSMAIRRCGDDLFSPQNQAFSNTIGGTESGEGNLISGDLSSGVAILGADTTENKVEGNLIGTDSAGKAQIANFGVLAHVSRVLSPSREVAWAPGSHPGPALIRARMT